MKSGRLHVHLENLTTKPAVFQLTPGLAKAARKRNPDVARRTDFTVGEDFEDFDRRLHTTVMLVTSSDVIRDRRFPSAALARAAPRLRAIHLIGAGVEGVLPLDWLPPGVQLTNNSGVHAAKAQESMCMALLALNAKLPTIVSNQQHQRWEQIFTPAIRGKMLLVVGLGNLGRAGVRAGRSLGLRVIGVSRSGKKVAGIDRAYRTGQLALAIKSADFVLVAVPLTPATKNLLDRVTLAATKPGVGIINMGRAGVMDYAALAELLREGHVGGAILDVFTPEPLPESSPLWSTPNLIVIPHVSSDDRDMYMHGTLDLVCGNLRRLMASRKLTNVVRPELGY